MTAASFAGRGQLQRPQRRATQRCVAQNGAPLNRSYDENKERLRNLCNGVKLAALVQMVASLQGAPVYAIERAWKPRRHHRSLGEGNTSRPIWETYGPRGEEKTSKKQNKAAIANRQKQAKKSHRMQPKKKRTMKEITLSAKNPDRHLHLLDPVQSHPVSDTFSRALAYAPLTARLVLVGSLIYFIFTKLKRVVVGWKRKWGQQDLRPTQGKWVRDRSLGGKEIFLTSHALDWNPLGADDARHEEAKKSEGHTTSLPSWWKSHPCIYNYDVQKKRARQDAQQVIMRLNNMRISGQDYTFDTIMELYRICNEASISVRTPSKNIGTSIYRYATKQTVLLTSEGIGLAHAAEPVTFLCRLSEMLKVGSSDAVLIIYAETAAKLRDALLQVCADARGHGQVKTSGGFAVRSVIRLLGSLPLRIDDAELIGSSITSSTTEQERILIYKILCEAGPNFAELIGKLLGKLEIETTDESLT